MGSVSLLQNVTVSSQPISSMDWSPDKVHKHTHRDMVYTTLLSTLLLLPPPSPSLLCPSCLLLLSPSLYPPPPPPPPPPPLSPLFRKVFLHAVHLIKQFVCVLSPNSTESNTYHSIYTSFYRNTHYTHTAHYISPITQCHVHL